MALLAPATQVTAGQSFSIEVQVVAGSIPVDGAAIYLNFDPARLSLESVTPGQALPLVIQNRADTAGRVDYAAGADFGSPLVTNTFTVVSIGFKAKPGAGDTTIRLEAVAPRHTEVTSPHRVVSINSLPQAIIAIR